MLTSTSSIAGPGNAASSQWDTEFPIFGGRGGVLFYQVCTLRSAVLIPQGFVCLVEASSTRGEKGGGGGGGRTSSSLQRRGGRPGFRPTPTVRAMLTSTADPWLYWGQAFSFKFIPTVIVAEHQTGQMALRGLCYYM